MPLRVPNIYTFHTVSHSIKLRQKERDLQSIEDFSPFSLWFRLLVADVSDVDGVLGHVVRVLLLLVQIRRGDCQHVPVGAEGQGSDGRRVPDKRKYVYGVIRDERHVTSVSLVELAEPLLVLPVPDVDEAVGAAGGERVVIAVEADGVHGVDDLNA